MNQNSADIDFMEEVRNEPTVGEAIFKEIPADATHLQEEREGVVSQEQQEIQEEAEVQIPTELEVVYGLMGINYPLESEYDTEEDSVSILEEEANGKFSRQQKYISNKGKLGLEFNCPDKVTPECGKSANKRGRKSLNELRELAGSAKNQAKITSLLNIGKGKGLPQDK
ncbi:hypothetical protein SUGI_0537500 [Cryptomeria japonica]|nr:hypothetical protein SUGI_0537500 [Cryptomeria japonica]